MRVNSKKRIAFKSGFTLIELIVTIAILGIVLTMAYSMGDFGSTSFNNGSAKSDIQSNIRIASDYITKELRYSSDAVVLAEFPTTPYPNTNYIYVGNDGILKQYYNTDITNISGNTSNNMITTLQFQIKNSKTVEFNIQETYRKQTFQLGSSTLLLNIGDHTLVNGTGAVIAYTTEPIITNINAKPVQAISITAPLNSISINGGMLQLTSNLTPTDASIKAVTWSVDDGTLSTIDTNGLLKTITGIQGKNIKVTATAQDGSGVSGTYTVTTTGLSINRVTSFTIVSNYDCIFNGVGTLQMRVSGVNPVDAADPTVTWSIDQPSSIAIIDQNTGLLTAKTTNSNIIVVVTAKTRDGSNVTKTKDITINPKLTSIYITGGSTITRKSGLKLSCYANPGGNLATPSIGVSQLKWSVTGSNSANIGNDGLLKIGNVWGITLTVKAIATLNDGTNITVNQNINVQK
ncbi:Ig-like domain-containing protein [Clostridium estertheticum]|uniref:Ig-like domain-containing protein n=1 Tax=Clostridium estertheticum TaxID=238834 RepID=UPI0013E9587D|nr:Ig-like domain-containing protein [Clostridium estertheticum]MBZ9688549.1 Ig-like domain-containing protein [Clostridium estertheticum]